MIKFRQINSSNVCITRNTDDGEPLITKDYILSDIWINPGAVLYLQEDEVLAAENKQKPLLKGLDSAHKFTKIFISENGFARQLSVVGEPTNISGQISEYKKNGR